MYTHWTQYRNLLCPLGRGWQTVPSLTPVDKGRTPAIRTGHYHPHPFSAPDHWLLFFLRAHLFPWHQFFWARGKLQQSLFLVLKRQTAAGLIICSHCFSWLHLSCSHCLPLHGKMLQLYWGKRDNLLLTVNTLAELHNDAVLMEWQTGTLQYSPATWSWGPSSSPSLIWAIRAVWAVKAVQAVLAVRAVWVVTTICEGINVHLLRLTH